MVLLPLMFSRARGGAAIAWRARQCPGAERGPAPDVLALWEPGGRDTAAATPGAARSHAGEVSTEQRLILRWETVEGSGRTYFRTIVRRLVASVSAAPLAGRGMPSKEKRDNCPTFSRNRDEAAKVTSRTANH